MTGPPRDWDKELAAIDKVMANSPALPPAGGGAPAQAPRPAAPPAAAPGGPSLLGTWAKVLLGVVLAGGMSQWPYPHPCGTPLFLYTAAAGMTVVAGLWAGLATWRRRMGLAHLLSMLVTLWGLGLVAAVVLPRIGYARVAATWWCP